MSIGIYFEQLGELENKFNIYKQYLENIISRVSATIAHTVITKGEIANPTPYYYERMGHKLNGKILQTSIISNDCMKYHYDSENRIIMIEEYSVFLKKFQITEIYFYNELTERLWLSSAGLARLFVFDNAFSNTQLCLSSSESNGNVVEEFLYEGDILTEIRIIGDNYTEINRFTYEHQRLVQIERICQNGYKELKYTTKKPNFSKIKENTYNSLKNLIVNCKNNFASFGIEGFIDQQQPMICVCFTENKYPNSSIADWNTDFVDIQIYDWQFNEAQEKKCVKMLAEILVALTDEGLLKDKQIYFHQSQACVTQLYSGVKSVFKKAGLSVK